MVNFKIEPEQPVFLVGSERSGSTLLRLMLDHHPEIAWCSEFEYAVEYLEEQDEWPELNKYYEMLETNRIFLSHKFTIDKTLDYKELVKSFLHQRAKQEAKPIVGASCHRKFDKLLRIWENAKFIHLVRDPRDVAKSTIKMGWAGNVWTALDRWLHAEETWDKLDKSLPQERKLEIKYYDLITSTEKTLGKICQFIGVDYNPKMLDYIELTAYDLPNSEFLNQWKKNSTDWEIQLVECRVGNFLEKREFTHSGLPSLEISPMTIQLLKLQSWYFCLMFRINRFGLRLTVLEFLARKFGLKSWQKTLHQKINIITNAHCKFDGTPEIIEAVQKVKPANSEM